MDTSRKALIFQGGWDGHEPALVAHRFQKMLDMLAKSMTARKCWLIRRS